MNWRKEREFYEDGVLIRVFRFGRSRESEYLLKAYISEIQVLSRRVDWNTWQGHCSGVLIISELVKEAKNLTKKTR